MSSKILEDLNDEQRRAVECERGPMLIVAGAGSGKTRVLTSRIAYLVELGVPPERILALTFTKKAAGEMKDRISVMVGERKARRLWMGTFHSVFIRFLREFSDLIGFPNSFTIYDTSDSVSAVKHCIKELGLDDKMYKPKEVQSRISKAKNDLITPTPYANGAGGYLDDDRMHKKPDIYKIYAAYCQQCKKSGVMDFDDILLYTNLLLKNSPEARKTIASRFSHILVDEYQDTNMAQYIILKKLSEEHHNICVVGDDSQSIYGFRGAQIQNILNFQKDFPEAKLFRLERNYRSTRNIVNAANTLIAKNEGRIPKNCVSMGDEGERIRLIHSGNEMDEASAIASAIINRMRSDHAAYADFAVLYRTNSQSRALEEQLRRRNIPYMIYSGNSFFERAEVKDVMAYLKLAVNPNDNEAFRRIVNRPARGIGGTSLAALELAAQEKGVSLMQAAGLEGLEAFGLKGAGAARISAFATMMEDFAKKAPVSDAYDLAISLAKESGIYMFFKADTSIEGQSRFANVEELLNSVKLHVEEKTAEQLETLALEEGYADITEIPASALQTTTLSDYLESVSLLSNVDVTEEDGANRVALMTVHTAKGLEFPYVFVAGMEENLFPSGGWMLTEREVEEKRRLFYVAITRARKAVALSFADTRMRNGKHEANLPSRFLREMAPQYIENPLRKEAFTTQRADEGFTSSRFSFGSGGYSWKPKPAPETKPSVPSGRTIGEIRSAIASRPKPPETPDFVPDPMSSFKAGDRIEHNRFGEGKVIEIIGQIPDLKAKISFLDYGEKLLLLKYAKIRHK